MRPHLEGLEPAERDPKKLRRTAFALVGIMLIGGFSILFAYNRWAKDQAADDRPAFVTRLLQNFKVARQDGSEAGLLDGNPLLVLAPVVFEDPESWATTREILREFEERYAGREDLRIVALTVDPKAETAEELERYAAEVGAELPQFWVAGAEEESTHKFLKNRLKAGIMPHRKDGRWVYDRSLVVVDPAGHVRQATVRAKRANGRELNYRTPVPFDFEQAREWDEAGRSEGLEKTNVETLRELFFGTIDRLLNEGKNSP